MDTTKRGGITMPKKRDLQRWIVFIWSALFLAFSLSGCTKSVDLTAQDQKTTIALILKMGQGDYWNTVKMGAEAAAKEFDVNLRVSASKDELDVQGQIELINQALGQGKAGALVLAASDSKEMTAVIERAGSLHTPVIAIDSEIDSPRVKSFIGGDHVIAGRIAGERLIELAGEKSRVAIIGDQGSGNTDQSIQGIMEVIRQYPEVNVVAKEYVNSDPERASELTRSLIADKGSIDGIVALNENVCVGVAEAIKQLGLTGKVKIIGFDSNVEELEYLQDGVIQATVIQNPFSIGYLGVKYAMQALNNKKIPNRVDTGTKIIDLNNMFWFDNQKLLFPFVK
jgi:ribose transport system substrate-binding protein